MLQSWVYELGIQTCDSVGEAALCYTKNKPKEIHFIARTLESQNINASEMRSQPQINQSINKYLNNLYTTKKFYHYFFAESW